MRLLSGDRPRGLPGVAQVALSLPHHLQGRRPQVPRAGLRAAPLGQQKESQGTGKTHSDFIQFRLTYLYDTSVQTHRNLLIGQKWGGGTGLKKNNLTDPTF